MECSLKNKDTFCFVLQILLVSLQYRKGDKRLTSSTLSRFYFFFG